MSASRYSYDFILPAPIAFGKFRPLRDLTIVEDES